MCDRVGVMAQGPDRRRGPAGHAPRRAPTRVPDRGRRSRRGAQTVAAGVAGRRAPSAVPRAGRLRVTLADGAAPADVNAALVAAGVRVNALVPERDTLEDVFLHLVEGIDVPR